MPIFCELPLPNYPNAYIKSVEVKLDGRHWLATVHIFANRMQAVCEFGKKHDTPEQAFADALQQCAGRGIAPMPPKK